MDDTLAPRGGSEPDRSNVIVFALSIAQIPFDYLLTKSGVLVPTDDIRLTVAKELNKNSTLWLDQTVSEAVRRIVNNN